MAESRDYAPPIEQLFEARLLEARVQRYNCLSYNDRACHGRVVLLAWVGGRRLEDHPTCVIREHDQRWLYLQVRNDEPRLVALRFRVECKNRCVCFAGQRSRGKHAWQGVIIAPTSYGKVAGCNFGAVREPVTRADNPQSFLDLVEVNIELELLGERKPQKAMIAFSLRVE